MKPLDLYDYLVIVVYFLFMVAIGFYFLRVSKGGKDFFAGGNMIPWWVSGMSLYMTNFSAWIFTGGAGFAYHAGWFSFFYFGVGSLGYLIGTLMTAKLWRRSRTISPTEYTRLRFNLPTQQVLGWVIALNFILSAGVQLAATSKLMAPVLQVDLVLVALIVGTVILAYSFMGGLWAVTVTDTLQGVIVLSIAFVVVPASLYLVGGFDSMVERLPALTMSHTYNNVTYDFDWLMAILLISSFGFAAGGAQRFFAVKDEKDARKVGFFAAGLGVVGPLMFGIPPLVARILWPDLSVVDFFKPYLDSNPQDLVYFAVCLRILPNGLVGVFLAAMLAATMSTLSSVYNLVSSIYTRDFHQGILRPSATDEDLLKIGRIASLVSGLIVIGLAVLFVTSEFGIFNLMQAFFTLFNVPVAVPIAFGLIVKRVPKWSAFAAIIWGLVEGAITRYALDWNIGPQVYLGIILTLGVFITSHWTGSWYRTRKVLLWSVAMAVALGLALVYWASAGPEVTPLMFWLAILSAVATGVSLPFFARMFSSDTAEQKAQVEEFFRRLATPINVAREVFGAGKKQVSTFPLVGGTTIVLGVLMSLVFLTEMTGTETVVLTAIIVFLISVGLALWYFGRKSEIRDAAQYGRESEAGSTS
jgi:SSS family solute:Na+ symporter